MYFAMAACVSTNDPSVLLTNSINHGTGVLFPLSTLSLSLPFPCNIESRHSQGFTCGGPFLVYSLSLSLPKQPESVQCTTRGTSYFKCCLLQGERANIRVVSRMHSQSKAGVAKNWLWPERGKRKRKCMCVCLH